MKKINFILLGLMLIIMSGCSKNSIRDNVDGFMQWTSGNKSPQFFMFADPKTSDSFTLEHKDFNVSAPLTYEKDWQKMTGWKGGFIYGGAFYAIDQYAYDPHRRIVLGYTFEFMSSRTTYKERERELSNTKICNTLNLILNMGKTNMAKKGILMFTMKLTVKKVILVL